VDEGAGDGQGPSESLKPGALTALLQVLAAAPVPEEAPLVALPPGAVVGRFEIVRELGRGAFGVVHEARDRELGRSVALKLVRPGSSAAGPSALAREAEAVARLSHPNLVTLFEVGHGEHGPYLVFELLRGQTLEERLEEGSLSVKAALRIAVEVARGLAHAHGEGVIHRDLKPSNVFLVERGAVKLLDFGMAHAFGRRRLSGGTPAFMAPEQWVDAPEDERTDVFALGVLLHRMLSGAYPFPEDGGRWASGPAEVARLDVPGAPELGALVGRMLERAPTRRPRDGAEVLATLERIQATLPASIQAPTSTTVQEQGSRLARLVAELKRRRVFRVLVAYGVFSFAVLQVIEPLMHGLHLGDWVLTAVIAALAVGFPAAVVLSWVFDLTADGVRRTPTATGPQALVLSRGRLAALLVGVGLVAALPGMGWYAWRQARQAPAAAASVMPSVAVLAFVNMSRDAENEYFSDGLSESILNALAQVPGLRVPARTSSFAFKGKQEGVKQIAAALQVATVLEGSVQKAAGRVRITAQLVNAADGYHLWSKSFDRELKDVFAVQDEISAAIAEALKLQLAPGPAGGGPKPGLTTNPEAYDAYLKGRQALNDRAPASLARATGQLERAIRLDPSFALAHADAAVATLLLGTGDYGTGLPLARALARAGPLIQKARALAPDHPHVLAAAGLFENLSMNPERALVLLDRSLALNPSDGEAHNWRKGVLESLERYDQVLPALAVAVRADPLSKVLLVNYASDLDGYGRHAEVGPVLERLRALDESWALQVEGGLARGRGDRVEAVRKLLQAGEQGRPSTWDLANLLTDLGLREEALRVAKDEPWDVYWSTGEYARAVEATGPPAQQAPDDDRVVGNHFYSLYLAGRYAEAAPLAARIFHQGRARFLSPANLMTEAFAARMAGRPAEAAAYRALAARRLEALGRAGADVNSSRALLAAYDGKDDEALALVAGPLTTGDGTISPSDLADPILRRLRDRPEFRAALARLEARLAAQRAEVVAMLCGPERPSPTWQPLPETCAGYAPPR
jgi:TolB-like protein